ncbi:YbjO family protein [Hydrogenophaga sp. 5NK40-0174]|uniref:YbjO family protein n=1 Tax=Hydrogenophaga sp. 5NK40-0174 TaxID=3127649 RepID=UPI00310A220C
MGDLSARDGALKPVRSNLVTGLAWVSIVACALLAVGLALELVTLFWLVPPEALSPERLGPGMPAGVVFVVRYLREISLAAMLVVWLTLWASVGLLRRRNWARWFFVVALSVGSVWNLVGLFFLPDFIPSPQAILGNDIPADLLAELDQMVRNMIWASIGSSLLFVLLHGWVVWSLVTSPVVEEFA